MEALDLLRVYVFIGIPFAFVAALKAKRMGQSFFGWLLAGLGLPFITLAVVQYYEPTRAERRKAVAR